MRFRVAPFAVATLLFAVGVLSAQDASDTATSQYEALRHSILVLKFGRSPEGQQIPSPECFNRAPWDRRSWFGGMDPCTPEEHDTWLTDLRRWREERRIRVGYDGSRYDLPALQWTQSSFIQPQMMVHDRYFYDPVARRYTVDRYLDDLEKRYGGIDAVLIWPTYPNMGIDDRNQHDLIRSMPGGQRRHSGRGSSVFFAGLRQDGSSARFRAGGRSFRWRLGLGSDDLGAI